MKDLVKRDDDDLAYRLIRWQDGQGAFPELRNEQDVQDCIELTRIHRLLLEVADGSEPPPPPPPQPRIGWRGIVLAAVCAAAVGFLLARVWPFDEVAAVPTADRLVELRTARMAAMEARTSADAARLSYVQDLPEPSDPARTAAETARSSRENADSTWNEAEDDWRAAHAVGADITPTAERGTARYRAARDQFLLAEAGYRTALQLGPAPERIVSAMIHTDVYENDKECGEVVVRLHQGNAVAGTWSYGNNEAWDAPSHHPSPPIKGLSIILTGEPLSATGSLEERPGQVNIDAGLRFRVELTTSRNRTIAFSGERYFRTGKGETSVRLRGPE